ncbi:Hvo_1808 family surface protein [Halocatena halophila]|uniref:Hvo_1808 family surface protein n=1 Tax=Halocatena halophila TaxID=2814576 RepID=UPI002ED63AE5
MANDGIRAIALVVLLVCAGCSSLIPQMEDIGREGGISATDSLSITDGDGLNESERKQVVHRTMARVETIRDLEFTEDVPVRVISRETYHNESVVAPIAGGQPPGWTNQVWEALWLVDEHTNASEEIDGVYASGVLGYYSDGQIVIVSDSETPRIDPYTLAHELTHALQDQQLSLSYSTSTLDSRLATNGLIEGDANVVESAYQKRCEQEWNCLERPDRSVSGLEPNDGIYDTVIMPYVQGPRFVGALRSGNDWTAVNRAYDRVPNSTEQIIHPDDYPEDQPASVSLAGNPDGEWRRFDTNPRGETVGEAAIYTMGRTNGMIGANETTTRNYSSQFSDGWAGDRLVPFEQPNGANGYVWKTVWESPADAKAFETAYRVLLERHGGQRAGDGVITVPEGPYADAFLLEREGTTVRVVNGPTPRAVSELATVS